MAAHPGILLKQKKKYNKSTIKFNWIQMYHLQNSLKNSKTKFCTFETRIFFGYFSVNKLLIDIKIFCCKTIRFSG